MAAVADKLSELAGIGKLAVREYRVRSRLNWHTKAKTAVRHLLHGEQKADEDERLQIDAAHARWCAEKIEANTHDTARLIASIAEFAERASRVDAEYFREDIEALRQSLCRLCRKKHAHRQQGVGPRRAPRRR